MMTYLLMKTKPIPAILLNPTIMKTSLGWLTGIMMLASTVLLAKEVPPKPATLVNDYAGVLSPDQRAALEQKLVAYDDSTSTQIAIVLDRSLEGDDVFEYSFRIAEAWGVGTAEKDNGVLIYAAIDDRKLHIHSGMGVQDYLTDAMLKRIIENVIKPAFRQGNYYGGLDQATNIMIELGAGRFVNDGEEKGGGFPASLIVIGLIIAVFILFSVLSRSNWNDDGGGYHRGGRYDSRGGGGWIIFPGGGWGGGGGNDGGGWSGGDFGGFGGGGFDGGGAGGDW